MDGSDVLSCGGVRMGSRGLDRSGLIRRGLVWQLGLDGMGGYGKSEGSGTAEPERYDEAVHDGKGFNRSGGVESGRVRQGNAV
jgi:hypothetical protein